MTDSIRVFDPGFRVTNSSGDVVSAAKIKFYDAGTLNARTVYSDSGLSTSLGSTVTCLSNGAPATSGSAEALIYTGTTAYKVIITTSADVTIHEFDDISGAIDTSGFSNDEATPIRPVQTKASDYTVLEADQGDLINGNCTGGDIDFSLPSAVTVGDNWQVSFKHVGTANVVNVIATGGQTIDGATTKTLNFQNESITITSDGANYHVSEDARQVANSLGLSMVNGTLDTSVSAGALTVSIKTLAGADPSASDPVYLLFRSATLTNGGYVRRRIASATSVVLSSGSELGATNDVPFRLWITAHDDAGTIYLGASNRKTSTGISPLNDAAQISTTAEGGAGGADSSGVIYTSSAVTSKAMSVLGYLDWGSGLSSVGTWSATPDTEHLKGPSTKLPGDTVRTWYVPYATNAALSTTIPVDDTIPTSSEGTEIISRAITLNSSVNLLDVNVSGFGNAVTGSAFGTLALFAGGSSAVQAITNGATGPQTYAMTHYFSPGAASVTMSVRAGASSGDWEGNGDSGGRLFGGIASLNMVVTEIMS